MLPAVPQTRRLGSCSLRALWAVRQIIDEGAFRPLIAVTVSGQVLERAHHRLQLADYWWPKITGRMYPEMWARVAAAMIFFGFNLTFFPQFLLGYYGMPRRYAHYPAEFQVLNVLSSAGATILGVAYLLPLFYLAYSLIAGDRRVALYEIVAEQRPMTVRQVFYQGTVRGFIEKTEAGYAKVQTDLVWMRRRGVLPYGWLADNTRWQRKPATFDGIEQALVSTAHFYRKSLWADADAYVEIWLEKDALAGVVNDVTDEYDVPLMVARGYASLSFLHSAAEHIGSLDVPAYIYHLGDFDPSGVNAGEKIEETLRELAPDAEITFKRIGVTKAQIRKWKLPTRPTKKSDTRSKGFGEISVELDAISPADLRGLVRDAIEAHMPAARLDILKIAEQSERDTLLDIVGQLTRGGPR